MFSFCCLERLPACLERLVCLAPCAMSLSDVAGVGEEVDLEPMWAWPVGAKEEEKDAEMAEIEEVGAEAMHEEEEEAIVDASGGERIVDASGEGLPPAIPKPGPPKLRRGAKRPAPTEGVPFFFSENLYIF